MVGVLYLKESDTSGAMTDTVDGMRMLVHACGEDAGLVCSEFGGGGREVSGHMHVILQVK